MRTRSCVALVLLLLLPACAQEEELTPPAVDGVDQSVFAMYEPLPDSIVSADNPATPEKVALGRMLFYDGRLSKSGAMSCYVCHPLDDYGTSHRTTAMSHDGQAGQRNEPSVYNAAGHVAQFWDGRAADLESQALAPVLAKDQMGMADEKAVLAVLKSMPAYNDAFKAAFPGEEDPVTFENFGKAVASFERGLLTPSRWDEFLVGKADALTAEEKAGFKEFVDAGCTTCHTGAYLGGHMYMKVGITQPWFNGKDEGRIKVTDLAADRMLFKVASLRNVDETWPYFHDGSVQRLEDAIQLMAWYQSGRQLNYTQQASIRAFLRSLTGPVDQAYIDEPALPPSPITQTQQP
jgi:cytochrome c peroxidase